MNTKPLTIVPDEHLWTQKYRPQNIDDILLPERIKVKLKNLVENGQIPNLMFSGPPGTGKTTAAKALANEIGMDCLFVSPQDLNMANLRDKIKSFATSMSMDAPGQPKMVIFDEADRMGSQAVETALRTFVEVTSSNCRFVLTCNNPEKFSDAMLSRFPRIDFHMSKEEKQVVGKEFVFRCFQILENEGVKHNRQVVAKIVGKHMPDWRRILGLLQTESQMGEITSNALMTVSNGSKSFDTLFEILKNRQFDPMLQWVVDADVSSSFFSDFWKAVKPRVKPHTQAKVILLCGEYQRAAHLVADMDLHVSAFLTEVMRDGDFF